jgi:hypothetical protein
LGNLGDGGIELEGLSEVTVALSTLKSTTDRLLCTSQNNSFGPTHGEVAVITNVEAVLGGGGVACVVTGARAVTNVRSPLLGEGSAKTITEGVQRGDVNTLDLVLAGDSALNTTEAVGSGVRVSGELTGLNKRKFVMVKYGLIRLADELGL